MENLINEIRQRKFDVKTNFRQAKIQGAYEGKLLLKFRIMKGIPCLVYTLVTFTLHNVYELDAYYIAI